MRLEAAPLLRDLADLRQREHLESAAVGQDRPVPVLELVQSADLAQGLQTWTKVKMIGVAKNDLRLHILLQVPMVDPLDRTDSPDRHEYGSPHLTMIRSENSCPCP